MRTYRTQTYQSSLLHVFSRSHFQKSRALIRVKLSREKRGDVAVSYRLLSTVAVYESHPPEKPLECGPGQDGSIWWGAQGFLGGFGAMRRVPWDSEEVRRGYREGLRRILGLSELLFDIICESQALPQDIPRHPGRPQGFDVVWGVVDLGRVVPP